MQGYIVHRSMCRRSRIAGPPRPGIFPGPEAVENASIRQALIIAPEQGRHYAIGRMSAIFKADGPETQLGYSISEWWLEPNTRGPGAHAHADDHVFYILQGIMSVQLTDHWQDAAHGSYVLIPGGTFHNFENRGATRSGFIS